MAGLRELSILPNIWKEIAAPREYRIVGDLEVQYGEAAAWFDQPGGVLQYQIVKDRDTTIQDLIRDGILEPIP